MGLAPETSGNKTQANARFGARIKGERLLGKQQGSGSYNTCFLDEISSFQVFFAER